VEGCPDPPPLRVGIGQAGYVSVTIRTGETEDGTVLADIYRRSSLTNERDRAQLLAHPDALVFDDRGVREGRTRIALVDDQIVGFATLRALGSAMELEDLFVDPDFMRRGLASALMRDVTAVAADQGVARIEVTANDHALGFYEQAGFVAQGTIETRFGPGTRMHLDLKASM
jgi:ribosomal protein S18 acetylase RimI-like enzyme